MRTLSRAVLETADELAGLEPGRLFVLTLPDLNLELYRTRDGELVVWAYRTIGDLVASCGRGQPWDRATAADLARIADDIDLPLLVALDVWHPDGARYPQPEPLERRYLPRIEPPSMPDTVWLPSRPPRPRADRVEARLYAAGSGERVLAVFTSVAALRDGCGPHQAAVAVASADLAEIVRGTGAEGIAVDPVLAEDARAVRAADRTEQIPIGEIDEE